MNFCLRIPNFVDMPHPGPFEFSTMRELALYLANFGRRVDEPRFHRFSLSEKRYLMLEYDKGDEWWVLGTIYGTEGEVASLKLPKWVGPKKKALEKEASGDGAFDIKQNQDTGLWEIWHRAKNRKIGACMDKKNVEGLIAGWLKSEEDNG